MPETREIIVYAFGELAETVTRGFVGAMSPKDRARETVGAWIAEWRNVDLKDLFTDELAQWGFPTDSVEWSLGCSQGDGVAFYGTVDLATYARKLAKLTAWRPFLAADPYAALMRNSFGHHYSHARTMDVDVSYDGTATAKRDALAAEVLDALTGDVIAVSRKLESLGYSELDITAEDVAEHCDANGYRFHEDGRIAP